MVMAMETEGRDNLTLEHQVTSSNLSGRATSVQNWARQNLPFLR
jgi:hypothetical protein